MALFLFVGIGLWAYYGGKTFATTDSIFPTFILERMPAGLTGLLVAAIIAATMSTHSGAINSLAAAATHDIYLPITGRSPDEPTTYRVGRIFALMWGVVLTGGALLFKQQGTPVVVVALGIASFTYGGLLGVFFLGNFWPRARQRDAILGLVLGITTMSLVVFSTQISTAYPTIAPMLRPFAGIAWPWYVLIGTTITMTVGIVSSYTHSATGKAREARA
jgi:Na+/proline symporter